MIKKDNKRRNAILIIIGYAILIAAIPFIANVRFIDGYTTGFMNSASDILSDDELCEFMSYENNTLNAEGYCELEIWVEEPTLKTYLECPWGNYLSLHNEPVDLLAKYRAWTLDCTLREVALE